MVGIKNFLHNAWFVLFGIISLVAVLVALTAGFIAFLVVSTVTPYLVLSIAASLAVIFLVSALLTMLTAKISKLKRFQHLVYSIGTAAILLPFIIVGYLHLQETLRSTPGEVSDAVLQALEERTHLLNTIHPGSSKDDLAPLHMAFSGKRIVALGEATHGTSEFFVMKHRLIEFLVTEMEFRHFAMETHPSLGNQINDYIQGGEDSPEHLLYWPWATVEYMNLLNWMRDYNFGKEESRKIIFHGIDSKMGDRDQVMAENVSLILKSAEPGDGIIVWAANSHVQGSSGGMGEYLWKMFSDDVYLLGLEFHYGKFTSRFGSIFTYQAGPFPPSYYSYAIAQIKGNIRFADFGTMQEISILKDWLEEERHSNHLYEGFAFTRIFSGIPTSVIPFAPVVDTPINQRFDGIIQIDESTPAELLEHIR